MENAKLLLRVLYVEDEEEIRNSVEIILRRRVEMVVAASNGVEGLALFDPKKFDVVITDITMPQMNGLEMAREIKRRSSETPVIVTTAHNEMSFMREAITIGIDRYLIKPIDAKQLDAALKEYAERIVTMRQLKHQMALLEQYKLAIDQGSIVSKADKAGIITYANDRFCELSGYTREELIGKPHNIVRHPDMDAEVFRDLWATISAKKIWHGVVKNRRKDGGFYIVDATIVPILGDDGEIVEYISLRNDLTEFYASQEKIQRARRLVESIMDAQHDIVTFAHPTKGLLRINRPFFEFFPFSSLDEFRSRYRCICDLFIEKEGYLSSMVDGLNWMEYVYRHPKKTHRALMEDREGRVRIFKVTVSRLKEEGEDFYVATFTDITPLEEALAKAQAAEAAKSMFLANMSHEIRTPMNGILGFVELLAESPLDAQQKEFVSIIRKSANSLLGIINDILDFSKIESGKMTIEASPFDPFEEFEGVIELFAARAREKEIVLLVFIDPAIPKRVVGDALRIRQVLANLISNAIKFTDAKGEVRVEIRLVEKNEQEAKLLFEVRDSGIGISPEQQKTIFKPFVQADGSVTRKYGGTGLGLAISAHLVSLMRGRLTLESELGKGSLFGFSLTLPIASEQERRKLATTSKIALWADDDARAYLGLLERYLDSFGCQHERLKDLSPEGAKEAVVIACSFEPAKLEAVADALPGCPVIAVTALIPTAETWRRRFCSVIRLPLNGSKIFDALMGCGGVKERAQETQKESQKLQGRVLVAEDNLVNQKLIRLLLEGMGLTVGIVSNGLEAFRERREGAWDLIFMDEHMPECDGTEATRMILDYERSNHLPHWPIVALTANAIAGDRERLLAAGMDDYLSKPIVRVELERVLRRFLTPSSVREPTVDLTKVTQELGLSEDVVLMLIEEFLLDIDDEVARIEDAVAREDKVAIKEVAHKIKGAAANLRLESIRHFAQMLEEGRDDPKRLVEELARATQELRLEITNRLA
ncbi:MAG: response regulator [Campylobacterales bacterium]